MINTIVALKEIEYETKEVHPSLLSSIEKRGIAIPVHVKVIGDHRYLCVDGNQRLSACAILKEKNPKFTRIPVMLVNDFSKSGSAFWGNTQNHH